MSGELGVGDPAPDFEVRALDGAVVRGRDLVGRPALLVFLRHLY